MLEKSFSLKFRSAMNNVRNMVSKMDCPDSSMLWTPEFERWMKKGMRKRHLNNMTHVLSFPVKVIKALADGEFFRLITKANIEMILFGNRRKEIRFHRNYRSHSSGWWNLLARRYQDVSINKITKNNMATILTLTCQKKSIDFMWSWKFSPLML